MPIYMRGFTVSCFAVASILVVILLLLLHKFARGLELGLLLKSTYVV